MGIHKIPRNPRRKKTEQPKVLGGTPLHSREGEPRVLDQRTPSTPVEIQTKEHSQIVRVESHTRSKPRKKNDPDVRLAVHSEEDRAAWRKVKNLEWEPE